MTPEVRARAGDGGLARQLGFSEQSGAVQWVLGLGAPLVAAVVWGGYIAPNATYPAIRRGC